jgi:hypothetical protein
MAKPKPVIRDKKNKYQNISDRLHEHKTKNLEMIDKGDYPIDDEYSQELLNEIEGLLGQDNWYERFESKGK